MQDSNKYLQEFSEQLLKLRSRKEMHAFLEGILTPKELEEIPNRLQIVKLLKKGISQKEIAQRLGVGVATVTRGAREIRNNRLKNI